jgi:hypothetical protein
MVQLFLGFFVRFIKKIDTNVALIEGLLDGL